MRNKLTSFIGILGVALFTVSSIVGGFLIEDYSVLSQYISETYAIDTEYGIMLRIFGHIPSGILIALFCFLGATYFKPSILTKVGFYGLGIFYGLATVVVGVFACDSGCNKDLIDPSLSQLIHNLMGFLTYVFVPLSIIIIGFGLRQLPNYNRLSEKALFYGVISILFVFVLFSNPNSAYIGLYQRIIEGVFVLCIVTCAIAIKNIKPADNNQKQSK